MSRLREKPWGEIALHSLAALLLGGGLSLTALSALLPGQNLLPALLLCALFAPACYCLFSIRLRFKWLLPLILIGAIGIWGLSGGGPAFTLAQLIKAGFLSFRGIPEAIAPYADAARLSICLIFSLMAALLVWDEGLLLSIFLTVTVGALSYILGGSEQALIYSLPSVIGILLITPPEKSRRLWALPVGIAIALLALLLTPTHPVTSPTMEKTAQDIRNLVEDYLMYDDYRSSFSLAQTGYQPLESRLGGPAEPQNTPVMEVYTDRPVLLRGKSYDSYTGLNWLDTLSYRRYLYISPRHQSIRDETLDMMRPLAGGENFSPETLKVHLLNPGATTLFAPQRTRTLQMESDRMVLYFNSSSELFITRDVAAGDSYTLTYLPFAPENRETEDIIAACAQLDDPNLAQVNHTYLALPGHIQDEIKLLANRITYGLTDPYEKALAIETYLRTNFRYDLDVPTPPENIDFVAWFLLGQRRGYCTYFATAMTVLCRLSGVPARYVTGFAAIPDENGVAYVTGEHAHAWTEVYLNGFGWLSFDATPRDDTGRENSGENPPPDQPPENPPEDSPMPSPSPQPEDDPQPEESPSPQPDLSPSPQPLATPTPPPGAIPSPQPLPGEESGGNPPWWLLILLLMLLIIALCIWRYLATEPVRKALRYPDRAVHIYFEGILGLLACKKIIRKPQETLHQFAEKAEDTAPGFAALTDAYAAQVYGPYLADAAPFEEMYLFLRGQAALFARLRLAVRRMITFSHAKQK